MSEQAVAEYAAAVRERYRRGSKAEKGAILDEVSRVTGYHRKAAIRLLGRAPARRFACRGRPTRGGPGVVAALRVATAGHLARQ